MPLDLNQPGQAVATIGAVDLTAAKDETIGFSLQIADLPRPTRETARKLRLTELQPSNPSAPSLKEYAAWQILPMPVDLNRAGYVRHTGLTIDAPTLPRALLPLKLQDGLIDLSSLRDPSKPTDPTRRAGGAGVDVAHIWVDLHLPTDAAAGAYTGYCDLLDQDDRLLASVEVKLTVYDFVLPKERHLQLTSPLDWDRLAALHREVFETVRPTLINRNEPRYATAVRTLDQLVSLAQSHRCQIFIPRLGPSVKWPAGQAPIVDWDDFVSVISPWMAGEAFADKVPLSFWPIPRPDLLPRFDRASQLAYWQIAANRFDQMDWLPRTAIVVDPLREGRIGGADSIELSSLAAQLLNVNSRVKVAVPMEEDQLLLANATRASMIDPRSAGRLMTSAPGLVFAPPLQGKWPTEVPRPRRWLRTDLAGLVPYVGAGGDERDVRLFAWLAYLREAELIFWPGSLPKQNTPQEPADPNDLVWFYPGNWFGVDQPLPTLQLKWLRRAQQDFEYLWLARTHGEAINSLLMARAITKPVQILPTQSPDPIYALMSGTVDPAAWAQVKHLLAERIGASAKGGDQQRSLDVRLLRWLEPQDRQFQLGRNVQYLFDRAAGNEVAVRFGVDVYNASDDTPAENSLGWSVVPPGWSLKPQPLQLPSMGMFQVIRSTLDARVQLDLDGRQVSPNGSTAEPIEWTFTNGYTRKQYPMRAVVPVAPADRRDSPLKIDGSLDDWNAADSIQNGPMVKMIDRPALQKQVLSYASSPTRLYSAWADENLYLAFRLNGVTAPDVYRTQNYVDYQFRRAWGEDLCELLIQPQYEDNSLGPVFHVICKPTGQWVERKLDPRLHADPWQPMEGLAIRYAGTIDASVWRGELAIPWKAIVGEGKDRPIMLRFNLAHHVGATGETSSWAGPTDFGRDESLMGLIYLRDLDSSLRPRPNTITDGKR